LASSVAKSTDCEILLSDCYLATDNQEFKKQKKELEDLLEENNDINFICLTLLEDYFGRLE